MLKIIGLLMVLQIISACSDDRNNRYAITDYVPHTSQVVIKINPGQNPRTKLLENLFFSRFRETEMYQSYSSNLQFVREFQPAGTYILAFEGRSESPIITLITNDLQKFHIDSLNSKSFVSEGHTYYKFQHTGRELYTTVFDSVRIITNSGEMLQRLFLQRGKKSPFDQLENHHSRSVDMTILMKTNSDLISAFYETSSAEKFERLGNWLLFDLYIASDQITTYGVMSIGNNKILSALSKNAALENRLPQLVPENAYSAFSITYADGILLSENLKISANSEIGLPKFSPENFMEMGEIIMESGQVAIMVGYAQEYELLNAFGELGQVAEFRFEPIYRLDEKVNMHQFWPELFEGKDYTFIAVINDICILSENMTAVEEVIQAIQSKTVISELSVWKASVQGLSDASSLLILNMLQNDKIQDSPQIGLQDAGYPLAVYQFIVETDYAHFHAAMVKGNNKTATDAVEAFSQIQLPADIVGSPVWLRNPCEGKSYVLVQDSNNLLSAFAADGSRLWTKKFEGMILGTQDTADLQKNNCLSLVFTTTQRIYAIDLNGNDIRGFPVRLPSAASLEASVFDYDKNRNFRIAVSGGKNLYMYDRFGKRVSGFSFTGKSEISTAPVHIRLGSRDYIAFAHQDGSYSILDRRGRTRVPVKDKPRFAGTPSVDGQLIKGISTEGIITYLDVVTGKISLRKSTENSLFAAHEGVDAELRDNLIFINSQKSELPFGLYDRPQIFRSGSEVYIAVHDRQENQVYVFGEQGKLLSGFPVFGTEIYDINRHGKTHVLLVAGAKNLLIAYRF